MAVEDGVSIAIKGNQLQSIYENIAVLTNTHSYATLQTGSGSATTDIVFTVTSGFQWLLDSLFVTMTTTAATGERRLAVDVKTSTGGLVFRNWSQHTLDASATMNYWISRYMPDRTAATGTVNTSFPFPDLKLPAGFTVSVYNVGTGTATGDPTVAKLMVRKEAATSTAT